MAFGCISDSQAASELPAPNGERPPSPLGAARCWTPENFDEAGSGRQLLSVSWSGLYNLGAGLSARRINDSDRIARFLITNATVAWPLFPIGAKRIALCLPFPMHHVAVRCLIESRSIRVPVNHNVACLPACGRRGSF